MPGKKVVGVPDSILTKTNLIEYLPNAVSVGESGSSNIEKITSVNPDVIILMGTTGGKEKSQLSGLNVPVLSFNCYILSDIPSSVENLGISNRKCSECLIISKLFPQDRLSDTTTDCIYKRKKTALKSILRLEAITQQ